MLCAPVCLRHRLQHKHPECLVRKEPEPSQANYDLDQFTEENSKTPSLNSTLGCLKVVDTFRSTRAPFLVGHAAATSNLDSFNLMRSMSGSSSEPASLYTAAQAGA